MTGNLVNGPAANAFDVVQEQIGKSSPEQVDLAAGNLESVKDSSDAQEPRFAAATGSALKQFAARRIQSERLRPSGSKMPS